MKSVAILPALLVMAFPVAAPAQEPLIVRGTVASAETGELLAGVLVEVVGTPVHARTDARGRYVLVGLEAGAHTLRFGGLGYSERTERVQVGRGEQVLDVVLAAEAIPLPAITVLLERTRLVGDPRKLDRLPGSAHYLGPAQLDRKLPFDDVHALLRQVPGLSLQEEDGYGLRPNIGMRGTGSERSQKITLLEDGVLIAPAPYASPEAYYFPVVGRMEAVEVRKGSSQIRYGPRTVGGALNLVSASIPHDLRLSGELAGGASGTRKLKVRAGDSYRHLGWLVETYQLHTDGFKHLAVGRTTGFDTRDYLAKLRVNTEPDARRYQALELKLGRTQHDSDETYLGLTDEDFARDPYLRYAASQLDRMEHEHAQAQLRHFLKSGSHIDLTTTLYYNDFSRNWYKLQSVAGRSISGVLARPSEHAAALAILRGETSMPGALKLRANNREYYARGAESILGVRFAGLGAHEIELGARYHEDGEDRFQHEDAYEMSGGRMLLTARGAAGSQENRVSRARAGALFLQDRIALGRWLLAPGMRYEAIAFERMDYGTTDPARLGPTTEHDYALDVWIPGVGASYRATSRASLFAGVHKGFGPPGPGAAPESRAEESVNYEAGVRYRRGDSYAELVGYFSDYENILGKATLATGETGTGDLFNGGAVHVKGVELALTHTLAVGRSALELPLQLAYTYTDARFRSSFTSEFEPWGVVEAGDELPYLPRHQWYASAALRGAHWRAELSGTHASRMRTVAGQGPHTAAESTDAALVLNLTAEYAPTHWGTLYATAQNVTDRAYIVARRPAGARPGLPRTLLAGIRLKW